jgi:hypothetical protein
VPDFLIAPLVGLLVDAALFSLELGKGPLAVLLARALGVLPEPVLDRGDPLIHERLDIVFEMAASLPHLGDLGGVFAANRGDILGVPCALNRQLLGAAIPLAPKLFGPLLRLPQGLRIERLGRATAVCSQRKKTNKQ